ncbi:SDR family NAD(P)-dependent oxidoreductase [Streptomyces sp. NPDC002018]|uniref:SDR family NAD(P)-dependent oxidoreductase n=1 Tax=Streptomyces sp. NPDC002018 TaxID=3364629 RepID=UPI0036B17A08
MPTIAIVGAGPILGLSAAKIFGGNGFKVALVSRTQENVDKLAAELAELGVEAAGFAGDVTDSASLAAAFGRIRERFGTVDVVSFSPVTKSPNLGVDIVGPEAMTVENTQAQLDVQLHGAIRTVREVLPGMVEQGSGTLLFTTAYASVEPLSFVANFGLAGSTVRYYARTLNEALADKGVHAAHISVNAYINTEPGTEADTIAQLYWEAYTKRDKAELIFQS